MTDDHEFIIKMPSEHCIPEYGLGYEIFHKMKLRLGEIAEFVADTDKSITFGDRLDAYTRVAINLKKLNLADDDVIAICARSHEQTSMPFIAGLLNGYIVTCIDPALVPREKALMLGKVTPKIIFVDEDFLQNIEETLKILEVDIKIVVFGKNTNGHTSFEEFLVATQDEIEEFEPVKLGNNEKTAIIVFTSGSTGVPKGVCLSHSGILTNTCGYSVPVTFAPTSPVWISYGLFLIRSLREGGALVLCKNFEISQLWKIIQKYKVVITSLSVYHLFQTIEVPLDPDVDISSLALLICTGASLPLALHSRLKEVVPNVHILPAYGLTEACGITLVFDLGLAEHREFFKNKPDSCGAPIPGYHYKIVDPETEEILGPNKPGELRLKASFPMLGYYKDDSSDLFDSDGFFKTGDILKYDEDRCFYFVDRLKEIWKFRGYKWSPTALEDILTTHPSVEIAVVIGIPTAEDGHLPMGIVKLRPNCKADPKELVKYVDNIVDENKKLRAGIKILDNLPLTSTDDHEYIIKMPDMDPVPEYGLGYEIFHKMKHRSDEIAEFIVDTDKSVTFGELLNSYTRVAINLKKLNLADDGIVAICADNHEHTSMPFIGGLLNGNVVTCVDPAVLPRDKALMFRKVTPKIIFVDEDFVHSIEETLKIIEFDIKIVVFGENTNGHTSFKDFLKATQDEIREFEPKKLTNNQSTALIVFSSGTTGAPKGACLSHLGILACTGGFSIPVTFAPTSPTWISYCLLLIRCLREGGVRILCKNFDISDLWRIISRHKVTMITLSVYNVFRMIEQPRDDTIDISSLVLMTCSGAALPLAVQSRLKEVIPNVHILSAYGLTEACGVTLVFDLGREEHREFFKNKPDSCGAPIPGFYYKIVDPETEEILGPNRPGELRLKSKIIMKGYYNEDSSDIFDSDGYLKTGDIMKYDEDKCFYFVDRLKEVFKFRSKKWSPTALESILNTHPSVETAVVIGIPNEKDGHIPMGIVKLRPNCRADPDELVKHVDSMVDENKKLRAGVKILDDLPVTATGKILKRKLRDMISDGVI